MGQYIMGNGILIDKFILDGNECTGTFGLPTLIIVTSISISITYYYVVLRSGSMQVWKLLTKTHFLEKGLFFFDSF